MIEEELTIKELKYKIKELEDDIELYLTLKKINFQKTQPGSIKFKDVISSSTNQIFDKFSHYVIKDSEYDETIYKKIEKLLAYQTRLLEKIKNISNSDSKTFITYLREEEGLKWEDVAKLTHFSNRQARRIYGQK